MEGRSLHAGSGVLHGADWGGLWWGRQTFGMGSKSEMLATVWQHEGKDGPVEVELTSDVAAPMVLHWGVRKPGKGEWVRASEELWPQGSTKATETAVDSPFQVSQCTHITSHSSPQRPAEAGSQICREVVVRPLPPV